ncbi:MAG: YckD family protein [Bacillota bacterium]
MQKKLIIALAALLILALAVPALAASADSPNNPAVNPLTPEQAKEITAIHKQMLDLRKQMVDKFVEYGRLTPEQGQQIKERINARQQYLEENPGAFGPGNCPYYGQRLGRGGKGPRGGAGGGAGMGPGAGGRGFGGGMGPGLGPCGWGYPSTGQSAATGS